jgi:hydrogenase nickel incorporation protein HypA/HybF
MHEVSIAQGLLKILQDEAEKHGATRVITVHVRIGELSNLVADALLFAFEAIIAGTVAEGAKLEIEIVPAMGHCGKCNMDFSVEGMMFFCPQCNGIATEIISGKEMEVSEIEVE